MNKTDILRNFSVPKLKATKKSPACVESVTLTGTTDAARLRITIRRNLGTPLKSLTFKFRLITLSPDGQPVHPEDRSLTYSGEDINQKQLLTFDAAIGTTQRVEDCTAFVSEVKPADGMPVQYDLSDFDCEYKDPLHAAEALPFRMEQAQFYTEEIPKIKVPKTKAVRGKMTSEITPKVPVSEDPAVNEPVTPKPQKSEPFKGITTEEFSDGDHAVSPKSKKIKPVKPPKPVKPKKPTAIAPADGSPVKKAPAILIGALTVIALTAGGIFTARQVKYADYRKTVRTMLDGYRFNEAYKLSLDSRFDTLLSEVCTAASEYYLAAGDYEQAYVYASGAPEDFSEDIAAKAAQSLTTDRVVSANALAVVRYAGDEAFVNTTLTSVIGRLLADQDYINALIATGELSGVDRISETRSLVVYSALADYMGSGDFNGFSAFVAYCKDIPDYDSEPDLIRALTSIRDNAPADSALLYVLAQYPQVGGIDVTGIDVHRDDPTITFAPVSVKRLMTTVQLRSYHSRMIAVDKKLYTILDGTLSGTELTGAVSVSTCGDNTAVLLADGTVTAVGESGIDYTPITDAVQIATGQQHTVVLHSDGTVTTLGSNEYGQCATDDWSDIFSVAAGDSFTLGLKMDGTLVACGSNGCGQLDVSVYQGISAIAAGGQTTVMLFRDGSVGLQGYRSLGLDGARGLTDVIAVRASGSAVLAELSDGSYRLFSGTLGGDHGDPSGWSHADDFAVGTLCVAAYGETGVITGGEGIAIR